jgi:hypothetical protein
MINPKTILGEWVTALQNVPDLVAALGGQNTTAELAAELQHCRRRIAALERQREQERERQAGGEFFQWRKVEVTESTMHMESCPVPDDGPEGWYDVKASFDPFDPEDSAIYVLLARHYGHGEKDYIQVWDLPKLIRWLQALMVLIKKQTEEAKEKREDEEDS